MDIIPNIPNIPQLGFQNTGSICYFNSLVQCLLSSKNFLQFILHHENDYNLFRPFLKHIAEDKWDQIFTTRLLHHCNMVNPNQSSSEYFIHLIDLLKLERLFEYSHIIKTICDTCHTEIQKKDVSCSLLINDNFDEFFEFDEKIDNFNCEKCKIKTSVKQYKTIETISDVVVVCLNKYFGKKMISYPPSFTFTSDRYRLVGTIEHIGELQGGHYVSRCSRNEKTILVDDSRVMEISDNNITPVVETYMVFYEKVK